MSNRFIEKIKAWKPPLVVSVLIAGLFSTAATILVATDFGQRIPAAVVYLIDVCAAVSLSVAVWAIVLLFRTDNPKQAILRSIHKTELTGRLYDDFSFRTVIGAYLSFGINILFAISKGIAGWFSTSYWLLSLAVYYLLLCASKFFLLRSSRKMDRITNLKSRLFEEWRAYRTCGILLMLLTIVLQGVVVLIMRKGNSFTYYGTLIFAVALYDFYCLISGLVYMVKTRKTHSPIIVAIKSISFVASLVSVLSLQTAMYAAFGTQDGAAGKNLMNLLTGSAVCILIFLFSLFMILHAHKQMKALKTAEIYDNLNQKKIRLCKVKMKD